MITIVICSAYALCRLLRLRADRIAEDSARQIPHSRRHWEHHRKRLRNNIF